MKHEKVLIKYISFLTEKDASNNVNYPHSGLFIATVENEIEVIRSDLIFVDKNLPHAQYIVPEDIFNKIVNQMEIPEEEIKIEPQQKLEGFTSNDFIIEFTKTLLNIKK